MVMKIVKTVCSRNIDQTVRSLQLGNESEGVEFILTNGLYSCAVARVSLCVHILNKIPVGRRLNHDIWLEQLTDLNNEDPI